MHNRAGILFWVALPQYSGGTDVFIWSKGGRVKLSSYIRPNLWATHYTNQVKSSFSKFTEHVPALGFRGLRTQCWASLGPAFRNLPSGGGDSHADRHWSSPAIGVAWDLTGAHRRHTPTRPGRPSSQRNGLGWGCWAKAYETWQRTEGMDDQL